MEEVNLLEQQRDVLFAIDAHTANEKQRTGVHNYAFHLIQAMKNHPLQAGERVVLYSYEPLNEELNMLPEGWSSKMLRWLPRRGWMPIRVAWELRKDKPALFFVPSQAIPRTAIPVVTTIHDVGFRVVPQVFDPAATKQLDAKTRLATKRARHLLTVSKATKQDVSTFYHVPTEKLSVTPLAHDATTYRPLDAAIVRSVQQKYRIGQRFFLTVGRLERKKNIATLIRAFDLFKLNRGVGDPYELLLIGNPGFGYDEIKQYIDASPNKQQIHELGYVDDADVAALMNAATAYLFPSWFEGFGIPNLEAMACGAPVLASNLPAHREVVGDAGVLIDPNEPEAWAHEMQAVIDDASHRHSLIEAGHARAAQFSWEKSAAQTWAVLRSLV